MPLLVPDARSAQVALAALQQEIVLSGNRRAVLESLGSSGAVSLPAYSMFSHTPRVRAARWLAPTARRPFEDAVAAYEAMTDRPLHSTPRPDRRLMNLLSSKWSGWLEPRHPGHWWVPAASLLGLMSNMLGAPLQIADRENLVLEHDGLKFKVTPNGMHSNFRGRFIYAHARAQDALWRHIEVPASTSDHFVARAAAATGSEAALWAASHVVQAEQLGVIPELKEDAVNLEKVPRRGRKLNAPVAASPDLVAAIAGCREVLDLDGTLSDLYVVMVPFLMQRRQFTEEFACPWTHPDHNLTPRIRGRLEELLATYERAT